LVKHKVLLETTVLIASSLYATRQDLQYYKPLKHQFFERSTQLIFVLLKHGGKQIGITTATTTNDAYEHLEKAIIDELGKDITQHVKSVAVNLCENRLDDLVQDFPEQAVNLTKVSEKFGAVAAMYRELLGRAFLVDNTTVTATMTEKFENLIPIFHRPRGPKKQRAIDRYRDLKVEIGTTQYLRSRSQLTRLRDIDKRPDTVDMTTLAEATCLHEEFNSKEPTILFLASTDKAFSPNLDQNGNVDSNDVTAEIEKQFSVCCDWPERIAGQLTAHYG
jgi:hypothetical protein